MPDDVSCPVPDPNEVVTRRILSEELSKELGKFGAGLRAELAQDFRALAESNRRDLATQARAIEETILAGMHAVIEAHPTTSQVADHELRITRLEARPAKRIRKTPSRRKPR